MEQFRNKIRKIFENVDYSWEEVLLKGIEILNDTGKELSGGNCGMTALALYKWVAEKTGKKLEIVVLTNANDEEELLMGEPDVYHIFLYDGEFAWDETGKRKIDDMYDIAADQYDNHDPEAFIFNPNEFDKVIKISRTQTNWNIEWEQFYKFLMEN